MESTKPKPLTPHQSTKPKPLTPHQTRKVSVAAQVDPRTVVRALNGERVLALPRERIARALADLGLGHLLDNEGK